MDLNWCMKGCDRKCYHEHIYCLTCLRLTLPLALPIQIPNSKQVQVICKPVIELKRARIDKTLDVSFAMLAPFKNRHIKTRRTESNFANMQPVIKI
jgi:hypothetical protein